MRIVFILLVLLAQLPARASQIVVGIRSKSLLVWDVWEQKKQLEHRLLLHNQGAVEIELVVRRQRFAEIGTQFQKSPAAKVLYRVRVRPHELVQLSYPRQRSGREFMEFTENGRNVGLLELDDAAPSPAARVGQHRFYASKGSNSGHLGFWLGFETLHAGAAPALMTFYLPKVYDEQYQLVKVTAGMDTLSHRSANLDSLAATDPTILRLSNQQPRATAPRPLPASPAALAVFTLEIEYMSNSYYYDEQKNKHPQLASEGGSRRFIPVFARLEP